MKTSDALAKIAEERRKLHEINDAYQSGKISWSEKLRQVAELEASMNAKLKVSA